MTDKDSTGQPTPYISLLLPILYITAKIIFSKAKVAVIELPYEKRKQNPLMPSCFPIMSHINSSLWHSKFPHGKYPNHLSGLNFNYSSTLANLDDIVPTFTQSVPIPLLDSCYSVLAETWSWEFPWSSGSDLALLLLRQSLVGELSQAAQHSQKKERSITFTNQNVILQGLP